MNENTQNIDKLKGDLHSFLINELLKLEKKRLPIGKLINEIQSLFSEYCFFTENQFFFEDKNFEKYNAYAKSSEQFINLIVNNSESGILDWCGEQGIPQLLPNLDLSTNEFFQKIFIYPISTLNNAKVYFVGTVSESSSQQITIDSNKLSTVIDIAYFIIQSIILIESNSNQNTKSIKETEILIKIASNYIKNAMNNFYFQHITILQKSIQAQILLSKTNPDMLDRRMAILTNSINEIINLSTKIQEYPAIDKISTSQINIDEYLIELVKTLNPIFSNLDIQINLFVETKSNIINTDKQLFDLVVFAILLNAIESIDNNGKIDLILQELDSKKISLSIVDNGKGCEIEDAELLFKPFTSMNKKEGHLGLSLYFAKYFTDKTKAKIYVSSEINKGTIVKLIFNKAILR